MIGLSSDKEEELFMIFTEYTNELDMDYFDCLSYFMPGTDTLVGFLRHLEENTIWFDYTEMDEVFYEISIYIDSMKSWRSL